MGLLHEKISSLELPKTMSNMSAGQDGSQKLILVSILILIESNTINSHKS